MMKYSFLFLLTFMATFSSQAQVKVYHPMFETYTVIDRATGRQVTEQRAEPILAKNKRDIAQQYFGNMATDVRSFSNVYTVEQTNGLVGQVSTQINTTSNQLALLQLKMDSTFSRRDSAITSMLVENIDKIEKGTTAAVKESMETIIRQILKEELDKLRKEFDQKIADLKDK
jgi:hypothetical protein